MWLKVLDTRRFLKHGEVVRGCDGIRRNVDIASAASCLRRLEAAQRLEAGEIGAVLGFLSFRIQPQGYFHIVPNLLTHGVEMNIPGNLGPR